MIRTIGKPDFLGNVLNFGTMAAVGRHKGTGGRLVIISGPSGVGKSTITKEVIKRLEDAYFSVSMTTRPQAAGEQNGRDGA